MPGTDDHSMLTRQAVQCLDERERRLFGSHVEALCAEYCLYPDVWYTDPQVPSRYLCFVDGVPFHYVPNEPVEYNNWEPRSVAGRTTLAALPTSQNTHHRHCSAAFAFYFERIAAGLARRRADDAARFAGCLCHTLQDNTYLLHALEGPDGTDVFVLDRLIRPPDNNPELTSSTALAGCSAAGLDLAISTYRPRLLGTSPAEASFHLYTRFCETVAANRYHLVPLVEAVYRGDTAGRDDLLVRMARRTVMLAADALHTAAVLGSREFSSDQVAQLQGIRLEDVRPVRYSRHLSPPYRFTPLIRGYALDDRRRRVPLTLRFDDGTTESYGAGLGMGAHADFFVEYVLPPGVFDRLRGALGLHADLGINGHVRAEWRLDGRVLWEQEFQGGHLAERFDLEVDSGGRLVLHGQALAADWASPDNNLVLGEPVLTRSPRAPEGYDHPNRGMGPA